MIRGQRANHIYISEDAMLEWSISAHVLFLKNALKYTNHSKKKEKIEKKLNYYTNMLMFLRALREY